MPSWNPNDLLTDAELVAYEPLVLTQFDRLDWQDRRRRVLEDWLFPRLEAQGLPVERFRTRHAPVVAFGYTSAAFTDLTTAAADTDLDGLDLATILAASTDYLYIGFSDPFRGLSVRLSGDSINTTVAVQASVEAWADDWQAVDALQDGTLIPGQGRSFQRGGSITWDLPAGTVRRTINGSAALYWVRLSCASAPTGAAVGPIAVIRRSRLAAVAAMRTLAMIYRSAPTEQDGPWIEKAEWYEAEAEAAFTRVLPALGTEFDTNDDDTLSAAEAAQTTEEVTGGAWTLERS